MDASKLEQVQNKARGARHGKCREEGLTGHPWSRRSPSWPLLPRWRKTRGVAAPSSVQGASTAQTSGKTCSALPIKTGRRDVGITFGKHHWMKPGMSLSPWMVPWEFLSPAQYHRVNHQHQPKTSWVFKHFLCVGRGTKYHNKKLDKQKTACRISSKFLNFKQRAQSTCTNIEDKSQKHSFSFPCPLKPSWGSSTITRGTSCTSWGARLFFLSYANSLSKPT